MNFLGTLSFILNPEKQLSFKASKCYYSLSVIKFDAFIETICKSYNRKKYYCVKLNICHKLRNF